MNRQPHPLYSLKHPLTGSDLEKAKALAKTQEDKIRLWFLTHPTKSATVNEIARDVLLSDRRRQTASKLLTDLYQEGFLCAAGSFPGKRVGSPMIRYALTKEPV
jgi:hypothetical protein